MMSAVRGYGLTGNPPWVSPVNPAVAQTEADMLGPAQMNMAWAKCIVETCVSLGCNTFFVAPGSRSTPLALAISHRVPLQAVRHFDERGLAFACLGFGRARHQPGVLVCTSGTAVANLFPALIEASLEHVPMLLLTADRPPELRETGANQTIFQPGIFGRYPVWSFDLPCPTAEIPMAFVASTVRHALSQASRGPVHVNCMFREPFCEFTSQQATARVGPVLPAKTPLPEATLSQPSIDRAATERLPPAPEVNVVLPGGDTIVVAGAGTRAQTLSAHRLADRLGAVFLSDITSQIHEDSIDAGLMCSLPTPRPRTIIHVGGRITSAAWQRFVRETRPECYAHWHPHDERIDPDHLVTERYPLPYPGRLDGIQLAVPSSEEFLRTWRALRSCTRRHWDEVLQGNEQLVEPAIAHAISELIPSGHAFFVGNSMPIRDADRFACWPHDRDILVGANRGASGIDGLIASSVGFAQGSGRVTTSLLGDLSFLHDVNSLALLAQSPVPVLVVVVNNNGGGIFDYLPVSQHENFEDFFVMPHHLTDFRLVTEQFGIPYTRRTSLSQFRETYAEFLRAPQTAVMELSCDRVRNRRFVETLQLGKKSPPTDDVELST